MEKYYCPKCGNFFHSKDDNCIYCEVDSFIKEEEEDYTDLEERLDNILKKC